MQAGKREKPTGRRLLPERLANAVQVMIAVSHCVILEHELAGQRSVGVERDKRCAIQLLVAEAANDPFGRTAVELQTLECGVLCDSVVFLRMVGVELMDDIP